MLSTIRRAVAPETWSAAVALVRRGQVKVESRSDDEIVLAVRMPGRPIPHEVYLWPQDEDWGCDCPSREEACVHAAAAVIAWNKARSREPDAPGASSPPSSGPEVSGSPPGASSPCIYLPAHTGISPAAYPPYR